MNDSTGPARRMSSSDRLADAYDAAKSYARQETIEPIKGAVRWVAVGTLASVSLGISCVFFAIGILRLSQHMGGEVLDGSWSFVHYFITLVLVSGLVVLIFSRISQRDL